ncbi:hypothetical protein T492DRAFT_841016 [Pavlovales sp. CCMP2436]|nr:hypothetical protein T492DRAFT_841016 [Pavlovales sp. CCMP2436]
MLSLLGNSFGGGTDVVGALRLALELLEADTHESPALELPEADAQKNPGKRGSSSAAADLVLVTAGELPDPFNTTPSPSPPCESGKRGSSSAAADLVLVTDGELPDPPCDSRTLLRLQQLRERAGHMYLPAVKKKKTYRTLPATPESNALAVVESERGSGHTVCCNLESGRGSDALLAGLYPRRGSGKVCTSAEAAIRASRMRQIVGDGNDGGGVHEFLCAEVDGFYRVAQSSTSQSGSKSEMYGQLGKAAFPSGSRQAVRGRATVGMCAEVEGFYRVTQSSTSQPGSSLEAYGQLGKAGFQSGSRQAVRGRATVGMSAITDSAAETAITTTVDTVADTTVECTADSAALEWLRAHRAQLIATRDSIGEGLVERKAEAAGRIYCYNDRKILEKERKGRDWLIGQPRQQVKAFVTSRQQIRKREIRCGVG